MRSCGRSRRAPPTIVCQEAYKKRTRAKTDKKATAAQGDRAVEFQILERDEGIDQAVRGKLRALHMERGSGDLLVVSPRAAERPGELSGVGRCRILLLPGWMRGPAVPHAASAVSYGNGPRDSITVSSREAGRLWVAIQRDLVTVEGRVVEQQEFSLLTPGDEGAALAVAGALLLLGAPPDRLEGQRLL